MLLVLAATLFGAAIVVFVMALRRPKTPKQPAARQDPLSFTATQEFGPRQLGPGPIVSHGGIDYVVRGSVTYREGPFVRWEHLLEGRRRTGLVQRRRGRRPAQAGDVGEPQGSSAAAGR